MASGATEFSLESIRDFMLYRGGRVTNHELVHHFKDFLTNSETKEIARDQFKHYVNALSLVVKEDNNKYLVLKKKYRGDAPLDSILRSPDVRTVQSPDSKYIASPNSQNFVSQNAAAPSDYGTPPQAAPHTGRSHVPHQRSTESHHERTSHKKNDTNPFVNYQSYETSSPYPSHQYQRRDSNSSFSGGSPSHLGPGAQDLTVPPLPPRQMSNPSPFNGAPSTTRLRTPPPYRPPPPPRESPVMDNFAAPYSPHDYNRFPAPSPAPHQMMSQQHPQVVSKDYRSPDHHQRDRRRPSFEAHSEEDFHRLNRSTSFTEPPDLGIPIAQNFQPGSQHSHSAHNLVPLSSQSKPSGHRQPPPPTDGMLQSKPVKFKSGSPSSDVSQTSSDDSAERRTMDRARPHKHKGNDHNKENFGPHNNSKYPRQGSMSSTSEDSEAPAPSTPGEGEKKISVKEKTQIFNRMASETNLVDKTNKGGSKSNRSSRAEKEYDDSISITSYGQDGQDWLVAAASSDFHEILRLLKAHPELMRRKDRHNGYTALHWAAKHGRVEVVKLLAGTHQADPNARSNGGYTPLHLAAMYNRQDVFDLLVHYGSDLNIRDYSGKKPRQYNTIASSTISPEHHKRKYRSAVAPPTGHPRQRGPHDPKYRSPGGPRGDHGMSPDDVQHFKRADKQRSSLFARGSLFSSKRKVKPKPSIVHTIVHPTDRMEDPGRRTENNRSVESSHSEAEEINVPKIEHTASPMRGTLRTRAKRGQPGRLVGPPRYDPRASNENIAHPHGPPNRRGMGGYPGPRGRGRRPRGKPRIRNASISAPAHHVPPHARRDRSATVPKDQEYGSDTFKSKLTRNVSIFSITSLFSGKKKSQKTDTSDDDLQESTSYKNLSEAIDVDCEFLPQEHGKSASSKHHRGTEARSSGAPVQTFKPYRSAGKSTTHQTESPSPWPLPETMPPLRQSRGNTSGSDSSAVVRPVPVKPKHKTQSNPKKEVREHRSTSRTREKSPREKEDVSEIRSSKPSRVKRLVEQEKRVSHVPASARYEGHNRQSLESSTVETDSDSEESETESDDSSMNKKLSALSIKAKLDAKKAKKLREAQAAHANGETPV